MSTKKLQILGSLGSNVEVDVTLTQEGKAADAKAVGNAIGNISGLVGDTSVADQIGSAISNQAGIKTSNGGEIFNDYENNTIENDDGSNTYAHAEGCQTTAGWRSHAEGYMTLANNTSHAEGRLSQATGKGAHAEGSEITEEVKVNGSNVLTTDAIHIDSNSITVYEEVTKYLKIGDFVALSPTENSTGYTITDAKKIVEIKKEEFISDSLEINLADYYDSMVGLTTGPGYIVLKEEDFPGVSEDDGPIIYDTNIKRIRVNKEIVLEVTKVSLFDESYQLYKVEFTGDYELTSDDTIELSLMKSELTSYKIILSSPFRAENYCPEDGYIPAGAKLCKAVPTIASGDVSHAEGKGTLASGTIAHAEGQLTIASGIDSHAEGYSTNASGNHAHAEGYGTIASGYASHAEGRGTTASKSYQHVQGKYNIEDTSIKGYAHIVGNGSKDVPSNAHTLDWNGNAWFAGEVTASNGRLISEDEVEKLIPSNENKMDNVNPTGTGSFSLNRKANTTIGEYSVAVGKDTEASGNSSHAEGFYTVASGSNSHAEGYYTIASGEGSHAEGAGTIAASDCQHVHGVYNIEDTNNTYIHIVGNGKATVPGYKEEPSNAHTLDWEGNAWFQGDVYVGSISGTNRDEGSKILATQEFVENTVASIVDSAPETLNTLNELSAALGNDENFATTVATQIGTIDAKIGDTAVSEQINVAIANTVGKKTSKNGEIFNDYTNNQATNKCAHAEGQLTTASGVDAHAEGYNTLASGNHSHAEGLSTKAGYIAHAEGELTTASGSRSHAEGYNTIAASTSQHVEGKWNIADINRDDKGNPILDSNKKEQPANKYVHIVGNGTSDDNRSNAHTLDWSGNAWFAGNVTIGADKLILATQKYILEEAELITVDDIDTICNNITIQIVTSNSEVTF